MTDATGFVETHRRLDLKGSVNETPFGSIAIVKGVETIASSKLKANFTQT